MNSAVIYYCYFSKFYIINVQYYSSGLCSDEVVNHFNNSCIFVILFTQPTFVCVFFFNYFPHAYLQLLLKM